MMKKFIAGLILSSVMAYGASFALNIPVTNLQSATSSCNSSETKNVYYYLSSNGLSTNPSDTFGNTVDSLIGGGNNGSSIDIWRNGVISSCNTWERVSNVVSSSDSNGALIFLNTDNCVFKIPNYTKASNPTAIDAQIHYSVGYRKIYDGGSNTMTTKLYYRDYGTNRWTCYPNGNTVSDYNSCPDVTVKYGTVNSHVGECINYRVFRCGDGLVNSPNGTRYDNGTYTEKCDPKDTSKTGWGNGGCDNSCNPITIAAPLCNSEYNGQRVSSLSESSKLCSEGTATGFSYNSTTHKWTRQCKNTAGEGVDCSATKPYCGDGIKDPDEKCDPKDTSKTGWGNGGCDNSCNPITVADPLCNSEYNGQRVSSLSESSKLCNEGTATGFKYNSTTHKWTWRCENTLGKGVDCSATKPYCGDGIKDPDEKCDPKDTSKTGWGNGGCDNSCNPITVDKPECNSEYNGQRVSSLSESSKLCNKGTASEFKYDTSNHKWTWKCKNTLGEGVDCSATKPYCGDGIKDPDEKCDPKDTSKTGWGNGGCDNTCEPITIAAPLCNSEYNGQRVSSLSESSKLCSEGTATGFKYNSTTHKWTRGCENTLGKGVDCSAIKPYCGDGIKDPDEKCDPKDTSKTGWGNGGCDNSCNPITVAGPACNSEYNGQRVSSLSESSKLCSEGTATGFSYNSTTHKWKWRCENTAGEGVDCSAIKPYCGDGIKDPDEKCDYNDSTHAGWGNGGCDYSCNPITVAGPACNSEYNGQRVSSLSESSKLCSEGTATGFSYNSTTHKWKWRCENTAGEGVDCSAIKPYCGDGIKDPDEKCDYNDSTHAGWGNGGCDYSCNPITIIPKGELKIEKTLIGSKEITNTGDNVVWTIKVTAIGGDVTNFVITDKMPSILGYKDYLVTHNEGLTISSPSVNGNNVTRNVVGTLEKGKYIEIQLTTYAKEMPDRDYDNVACVKYVGDDGQETEKCDDEQLPAPKLWIKKYFTDGTKIKTVKIGDLIGYKVTFGNKGTASATITSLKDFLPKNVEYVSSEIFVNGQSVHSNKTQDGVYIDIYGGLTLAPKAEGYIILTGKVLSNNKDSRTNFACIYLNDKQIDCDNVIHNIEEGLVCTKPDIATSSFGNGGGSTSVVCKTSPAGEKADSIELDCGNGTRFTGSNVSSLSGICTYPANSTTSTKSYTVVCKVNNTTKDECKATVSVAGKTPPPSTCFVAGTKVVMADGTEKNIEDVKIGEKVLGSNGTVNTVLGYDRPVLGERHLWSINGSEYFVSDEHPFMTTQGWKSFNPEMTKLEIDLNTTELKVGDILITTDGEEGIKTVDYIDADYDTPLYNFLLDGDHTYYANNYLVHNKGGNDPYCTKPKISGSDRVKTVVCETDNGKSASIKIDCGYGSQVYTSTGKVVSLTGTCDYTNAPYGTYKILCYADDKNLSQCNDSVEYKQTSSTCFVAGTKVVMANGIEKNIEDVKIGEKVLGSNGTINTVLGYDRPVLGERHLWSINGSEYFVSDEHPFMTTQGWKSFNPEMTKLEIDLNTAELKVGDVLITADGEEEIKTVDYINANYDTPLYNFLLDGDHTYYANNYLVHNKGGGNPPKPSTKIYDSAACFNVNTNNISIEQGEILPFFWNIKNMENVKDWAMELTGGFKDTVSDIKNSIINNNEGNKCSDDGFIALNSMICSFRITNGNQKIVYEGKFPCLRSTDGRGENWVSNYKLLDAWMTYGKNKYRGDGNYKFFWSFSNKDRSYALRSNLNAIENFGTKEDVFGEYKIALTNIEYLQCRDNRWTLVSPEIDYCENNFVLTNPYTVQKTPSGNLKASTTTLDKYLYMDSKNVLQKAGGLLNAIATSEYSPNETVNKAMTDFITKYQKLAVSVKSSNGKTIKKVPGKDIYFVEGDINLGGYNSDVKFSKPVTFVQTKGNAIINGSVEGLNMMLLTNGSITFNGSSNCKSRQVVKGIFYAKGGIYRTGVPKNNNINNSQRCTEGGLTIKGVLIGGGLDGMMKNSRSNFNNWFETTDKKGVVMNGASVLIEYSPSVFTKSTMPPGAEDFTTALSIYKN